MNIEQMFTHLKMGLNHAVDLDRMKRHKNVCV